jgi:hypothetical protein
MPAYGRPSEVAVRIDSSVHAGGRSGNGRHRYLVILLESDLKDRARQFLQKIACVIDLGPIYRPFLARIGWIEIGFVGDLVPAFDHLELLQNDQPGIGQPLLCPQAGGRPKHHLIGQLLLINSTNARSAAGVWRLRG